MTRRAARSIFYMGSIGGLLAFSSTFVWFGWTYVLTRIGDSIPPLSYLEAIGIVAIAYVIASGLEFGYAEQKDKKAEPAMTECPAHEEKAECRAKIPPHMTDEEKKILLQELERRCIRKNATVQQNEFAEHHEQ